MRTADVVYISCNAPKRPADEPQRLTTMSQSLGLSGGCRALRRPTPSPRSLHPQQEPLMRRILLVIAVVSSLVIASTASAAQNRASSQASGARKGPVAKLVELEKRKNEWLRQQFLGK